MARLHCCAHHFDRQKRALDAPQSRGASLKICYAIRISKAKGKWGVSRQKNIDQFGKTNRQIIITSLNRSI